jgi:hypothetical protein
VFFAVAVLLGLPVFASVPQTINYQGYLTNSGGTPVTGNTSMTFRLYNAASGGVALWTETQPTVSVSNGTFSVLLGSATAFSTVPLAFDVPYWMTVQINADPEMAPRQPLVAVPYAFRASALDGAASVAAAQVTGALTAATLPAGSVTGTLSSIQIGINPTTQLLPAIACATSQIPKWNGSGWACAADDTVFSGNLTLANPSTAVTGNIEKGTSRFIHNYGANNTFVGENAGNYTNTGDSNAGFGKFALLALTTGNSNTALGGGSLNANTAGNNNTAGGTNALSSNTTGNQNTAFGRGALESSITTSDNAAFGAFALSNNSTGTLNTAVGTLALQSNLGGQ